MPDVAREINENGLDSSTVLSGPPPGVGDLLASARYRYFSLLMAKDQFTSHYDTPGILQKPPGLSPF